MDLNSKRLLRASEKTLTELGLLERDDLEAMIAGSFDAFCDELGVELLLVGKQFYVADEVKDHGDLLALDKEGKAVIIELKRKYDDNQLYQALSYASMIAEWDLQEFSKELANLSSKGAEEANDQIVGFLDIDPEQLNEGQRVYLLAEDFDYQTLMTAKWLREKHGVDISCVRLDVSGAGNDFFLACVLIYPTPGLDEHAVNARRRDATGWIDWDTTLKTVKNPAAAQFFRVELAENRETGEGRPSLYFRVGGKRRFNVHLRRNFAYVWQPERFAKDLEFLKQRLGASAKMEVVNAGQSLRFYLESTDQFSAFKRAVTEEIKPDWFESPKSVGDTLTGI
jgi:hypothetical protein